MKRILNRWEFFIKESKSPFAKTPLEEKIEAAWAEQGKTTGPKEGPLLANIKASAHALQFLMGGELANQSEYLAREQFGKTNAQRIKDILKDPDLFSNHYKLVISQYPPRDKRFEESRYRMFKGVKMIDRWTRENLGIEDAVEAKRPSKAKMLFPIPNTSPVKYSDSINYMKYLKNEKWSPATEDEVSNYNAAESKAFDSLFERVNQLASMITAGHSDFESQLGKVNTNRSIDDRHSGGAFTTGLIVLPTEATEEETNLIGQKYDFHLKHRSSNAYVMAIQAEKKLQEALNLALSLWRKYPFKDGAERQIYTGAVLRMERALERSIEDETRIESNPEAYQVTNTTRQQAEISDEEKAEELLNKAKAGDKTSAGEAYALFKKLKNRQKAREARTLMR